MERRSFNEDLVSRTEALETLGRAYEESAGYSTL